MAEKKPKRSKQTAAMDLLKSTTAVPTKRQFVEAIVEKAGGADKLAAIIWAEFSSPTCAPSVRAKIVELIVRSMGEVQDDAPPDPSGFVDDADLEAYMNDRVGRLLQLQQPNAGV